MAIHPALRPAVRLLPLLAALALAGLWPEGAGAQSQIQRRNYCGVLETVNLPAMVDLDRDGLSDLVEGHLLSTYAPPVFASVDDGCPSGAPGHGNLDGRPNLVPCRINLFVDGQGFVMSSRVLVGGTARPTAYVSPTRLQVTVPASDVAARGSVNVKVKTRAPAAAPRTSWR